MLGVSASRLWDDHLGLDGTIILQHCFKGSDSDIHLPELATLEFLARSAVIMFSPQQYRLQLKRTVEHRHLAASVFVQCPVPADKAVQV